MSPLAANPVIERDPAIDKIDDISGPCIRCLLCGRCAATLPQQS